ncbi:MAG: DUF6519 domain-containing protein [Methylocella sp.]
MLRTLIVDLLGSAGGPQDACGFELVLSPPDYLAPVMGDFVLGEGSYYVDGILVESDAPVYFSAQPYPPLPQKFETGQTYLAYLDVWERHITYIEDDSIREAALNGPDTCTRAQTVWQVKLMEATGGLLPMAENRDEMESRMTDMSAKMEKAEKALAKEHDRRKQETLKRNIAKLKKQIADLKGQIEVVGAGPAGGAGAVGAAGPPGGDRPGPGPIGVARDCDELLVVLEDWGSGLMAAAIPPADKSDLPCVLPPKSRYRGLENHLYRIEVHTSGNTADANRVPTFKWSRENGSVVTLPPELCSVRRHGKHLNGLVGCGHMSGLVGSLLDEQLARA